MLQAMPRERLVRFIANVIKLTRSTNFADGILRGTGIHSVDRIVRRNSHDDAGAGCNRVLDESEL